MTTYRWTARSGVEVTSTVPERDGTSRTMDSAWTHAFVSWYRWARNIRRAYSKPRA